ncbi:MAG: iron-containing alcohol dehydrogenase [Candidatus Hadarchaeaceae archaeon]
MTEEISTYENIGHVEFNYPKKYIFGTNAVDNIYREVELFIKKGSKILIVTDKNLLEMGLVNRALKPLEEENYALTIYDQAYQEPTIKMVESVAEKARAENPALVIGFGGGSALDMAKFAAAAVTNPGPMKDYITYLQDSIKVPPVPKILIPTTAGTGSEASGYAVVIEEKGYKGFVMSPKIVSDVAIVDPTLSQSMPPKLTAHTGLDALSHGLEAVLSFTANMFSDTYAYRAVQLTAKYLRRAYHHGKDLVARSGMALAATYGGIAITTPAAVNVGHCIGETIGPRYRIPHGAACGLVLPYITKFNIAAWPERVASLAKFFTADPAKDVRKRAYQVVEGLKDLLLDLNMPISLKELNVPRENLEELATFIAKEQQYNYGLPDINPAVITLENTKALLNDIWEGNI